MNTYETIFVTVPTLTEDEERSLVGGLAQIVTDGGGTMVVNDRMGRRRLAYPVQKFDDGVYTRFLYDGDTAIPKELERRIRISDKVIRYLSVRLEPDWAEASKEQAVRDAQARAEAEIAREAAGVLAEGALPRVEAPADADDTDDTDDDDEGPARVRSDPEDGREA